jgi:hypothetical protein
MVCCIVTNRIIQTVKLGKILVKTGLSRRDEFRVDQLGIYVDHIM